jgi:tetraacyldisaccharide-1-P 4'-kinase
LVTTRKDWVRLPEEERAGIDVLDVALRWREPAALNALLAPLIKRIGNDRRAAPA